MATAEPMVVMAPPIVSVKPRMRHCRYRRARASASGVVGHSRLEATQRERVHLAVAVVLVVAVIISLDGPGQHAHVSDACIEQGLIRSGHR